MIIKSVPHTLGISSSPPTHIVPCCSGYLPMLITRSLVKGHIRIFEGIFQQAATRSVKTFSESPTTRVGELMDSAAGHRSCNGDGVISARGVVQQSGVTVNIPACHIGKAEASAITLIMSLSSTDPPDMTSSSPYRWLSNMYLFVQNETLYRVQPSL